MKKSNDLTLLYRIAKYYYIDKLQQQEIADIENISRSQISRLLARAISEGIVNYEITLPNQKTVSGLDEELAKALNLKRVILIPSYYPNGSFVDDNEQTKNLALGAAEHIDELTKSYSCIGVGWGKSIYLTSLYLRRNNIDFGRTFVPLIGISGDINPYLQINNIVDRFAEQLNAERFYINLSALGKSMDKHADFEKHNLSRIMEYWNSLDAAIVGIGIPPNIATTLIYEFTEYYIEQIRSSKAVGDILSQFYYSTGEKVNTEKLYSLVALPLDRLKKLKDVIAIAAGENKVEAIIAATKSGYIKTLITDYDTALKIIERNKK